MTAFEYRVVPAPKRGVKTKTAKTAEERFAVALAEVMNALGAEGWDYVRSDMLPCEERSGLTGKATVYHTVMVFRREIVAAAVVAPAMAPVAAAPTPAAVATPVVATAVAAAAPLPSPAAVPSFLTPAPRAVDPPMNPAPRLGPAGDKLAAE
jgi:hypothetical protein